jgi:sugar-specific transcriptional regulator TrmB
MDTSQSTQYTELLSQAGLEPDQAIIYEILLKNGPLKAGKIAQKSPLKRGLVYKILTELVEIGLVYKDEANRKVAMFEPAHPIKLKDIALAQEAKLKTAQQALDGIMSQLASDYSLSVNRPTVRYFEGIGGLQKIYNDILSTKQDFFLIRSIYEPAYKEQMYPAVMDFISKRVAKNISVTALTPKDEFSSNATPADDKKILFNRTWVEKDKYDVPVEIDIYGNKTAFLSFGKELIGVIIDSPQIATALKKLFTLAQEGAKQPLSGKEKISA